MNYKKVIENNLDKIHTTKLSERRVQKNLNWGRITPVRATIISIINYLKYEVTKRGKNYYLKFLDKNFGIIEITINSSTFTIITAHKIS